MSMNSACAGLSLLVFAACSSQHAATPQNVAGIGGTRIIIELGQHLGWIGLAPLPARDEQSWLPVDTHAALVMLPAEDLVDRPTVSAIDTTGHVARLTPSTMQVQVPYGCDDNKLDAIVFTGDKLAPGPVWLLPPDAPASWHPKPLAIATPVEASETRRRDTVGPLALELERTDGTHGTLKIMRGGRAIHVRKIERAEMEGAPSTPLDFRQPGVAIPVPVAAWSIAEGGPILLVLQVPSYEGLSLHSILVEDSGGRELGAMETYLYRCAF